MTGDSEGLLADNFRKSRGTLFLLALAYLAFVIYGSLVPLHFHGRPLAEAWQDFLHIRYLSLGIGSRADWVANILLFIPLAFLWLGVLWHRRSFLLRAAASLLVLGAGGGLSVGIEFAQLFFPPRTVSLNDILAEGIGAVVGIVTWWATGPRVLAWVDAWRGARAPRDMFGRALYLYLFFFFAYNLLPLDLTISPVEIYHKWREGRVVLVPFGFHFASRVEQFYGTATDMLLWVPVAFLYGLSGSHRFARILRNVVFLAALLEFLQLFVYTRVTDVTQVLMAALGGAIGAAVAGMVSKKQLDAVDGTGARPQHSGWLALWLAALIGWMFLLPAVFWYPYDFHLEREFIRERLMAVRNVPFAIYYFGTEYRAATEVLHKMLFFLPLGMLLAFPAGKMAGGAGRRLYGAGALLTVALAAAAIEVGKVFIPGKYPDLTNWGLEILGGGIGYWGLLTLMAHRGRRA